MVKLTAEEGSQELTEIIASPTRQHFLHAQDVRSHLPHPEEKNPTCIQFGLHGQDRKKENRVHLNLLKYEDQKQLG